MKAAKEAIRRRNETTISTLARAPQRSNCCAGQSPEMGGRFVLAVSARVTGGRVPIAMAGIGFLQSLWEKPIWEGVWPYLDLRTASMEGNVPVEVWAARRAFFLPDTEGTGNEAGR